MQQPSTPRRRVKAAVGLTLAAGLAATGITVAVAENGEPGPSEAERAAEVRYDGLPSTQRTAWMDQVGEYVELDAARRYAIAVYARAAAWQAVRQYVAALEAASASSSSSYSGGGSSLEAIRACESGGDYGAVSSSGTYRGAYQFDQQTWNSVGGSGDPAAASPAEQDQRAQMLYDQRGSSPWPVCG